MNNYNELAKKWGKLSRIRRDDANCIPDLAPLTEKENLTTFMGTFPSTCYYRLIGHVSEFFSNLVQIGERIGDGLKTDKIKHYQALFDQLSNGVGGSIKKTFPNRKNENDEKEVHSISGQAPRHEHSHAHSAPIYQLSTPSPSPPANPIVQYIHLPQFTASCPPSCLSTKSIYQSSSASSSTSQSLLKFQ